MRVLVVYPYFVDHSAAGHSVMYDTLVALAARGHQVTVVSGEGGYMQGRPAPDRPWYRRIVYRDQVGPITVYRTLSYGGHHKGMLARLLSYALLSLLNPVAVLLAERADVVLLSPPPLFPIYTSMLAARLRRMPIVTEVRDVWPGSIVQMGLLRNRWLIRLTAWMERCVYDRSRSIVALTEGIADDITSRGWPREKVHTLPCAVDTSQLAPDAQAGQAVRRALGCEDRFVLLYFGALGEANNLPVLLRAAERLADDPRFLLMLVGDGLRGEWVRQEVATRGLANVRVLPAVPRAEAVGYLNAADACVVTLLDIPLFRGAIPTKLVEYLACGRPVLCGVRGEAQRILDAAGAGCCFDSDDDQALAQLVRRLMAAPEQAAQFGRAGRAHAEQHFDAGKRLRRMEALLAQAADA